MTVRFPVRRVDPDHGNVGRVPDDQVAGRGDRHRLRRDEERTVAVRGVGNDPRRASLRVDGDHGGAARVGHDDLPAAGDRDAHGIEEGRGRGSLGFIGDSPVPLGGIDREDGAPAEVEDKQPPRDKRHIDGHDQCGTGSGLPA